MLTQQNKIIERNNPGLLKALKRCRRVYADCGVSGFRVKKIDVRFKAERYRLTWKVYSGEGSESYMLIFNAKEL